MERQQHSEMVSGEITALDKTGLDSGAKYKDKENTHGNYSKKQKLQYRSRIHRFSSIKNKGGRTYCTRYILTLIEGLRILYEEMKGIEREQM